MDAEALLAGTDDAKLKAAEAGLRATGLDLDGLSDQELSVAVLAYWIGHGDGWMAGNTDPDAWYEF